MYLKPNRVINPSELTEEQWEKAVDHAIDKIVEETISYNVALMSDRAKAYEHEPEHLFNLTGVYVDLKTQIPEHGDHLLVEVVGADVLGYQSTGTYAAQSSKYNPDILGFEADLYQKLAERIALSDNGRYGFRMSDGTFQHLDNVALREAITPFTQKGQSMPNDSETLEKWSETLWDDARQTKGIIAAVNYVSNKYAKIIECSHSASLKTGMEK